MTICDFRMSNGWNDFGLWSMDSGLRSADNGQRSSTNVELRFANVEWVEWRAAAFFAACRLVKAVIVE